MTFSANLPVDGGGIVISSIYSKDNNTFPALQGAPGAYVDANSNASTAVVVSFLQPLIVQKGHNVTGSGGKTLTYAFGSDNKAGNSIVVCMGMGEVEGAGIALAVTDTPGNTYTQAVKGTQSTTLEAAIFYATNIAAGANTVTLTISGGSSSNTAIAAEVYEVFGAITVVGALDATATGSNAGSASVSTGAINPVVPNEIAFTAIASAGGTITAGTNWTLDSGTLSPSGGNLVSFGAQSQTLTTIASVTPQATLSGSNAWAAACATFKTIIVPVEGTVTANQGGSNWSVNVAQVAGGNTANAGQTGAMQVGGAVATNNNVSSATNPLLIAGSDYGGTPKIQSLKVDSSGNGQVAVTNTPSVAQSGTWTVQPGNTANTTAWLVAPQATTSGGSTASHTISASGTNATSLKGSAGVLYGFCISNSNASARYFKLYNKASAPTVGTDTPVMTVQVPGSGTVIRALPVGLTFATGIAWALTTGIADSDTGSVGTDISVDLDYK